MYYSLKIYVNLYLLLGINKYTFNSLKTNFSKLFLFLSYTFFININVFANGFYYVNDTIQKLDTVKTANNSLLGKILYEATDTTSISPKDKLIRLYNNAKITYQDMEITSGIILSLIHI